MTITTNHPSSSYGLPVILDDAGQVMDYAPGIQLIRARLNLSTADLAAKIGVSPRTVEGWEQGRTPSKSAVRLIASLSPPEEI